MKSITDFMINEDHEINEDNEINEDYESFSKSMGKNGVPDDVIWALYDNRSKNGTISETCLCRVLEAIFKNLNK